MRDRIERWLRVHPNAGAVFVVLLAIAITAFGIARVVQVWHDATTALLFVAGATVGGTAAALSYRAAFVDRWEVSDELRVALKAMQAVSWAAAAAAFRRWGPDWLTALACGFVVVIGAWLLPAAVIGRRLRRRDPEAADELVARSRDVMG